jgi:hypothetical protein
MKLSLRKPVLVAALSVCAFGCSSSAPDSTSDAGSDANVVDVQLEASQLECVSPVPTSKCNPQNPGSVVRGVLTFDPTHFSDGENVNLAMFLYHQWIMEPGENQIGGHPHAYKYVKGVDVTTGQLQFDIDLCELGVAMYSEENCAFNLVVMLDENGDNDPDARGESALTPTKGELVKLMSLDVSCHGDSQCVAVTADCTGGVACTTFTPIAMSSCICAADSCPSQSVICTEPDAGAADASTD